MKRLRTVLLAGFNVAGIEFVAVVLQSVFIQFGGHSDSSLTAIHFSSS